MFFLILQQATLKLKQFRTLTVLWLYRVHHDYESKHGSKFLGVHVSGNMTWHLHIFSLVKKASRRLHFLYRQKTTHLNAAVLTSFDRQTVLSSSISVWYERSRLNGQEGTRESCEDSTVLVETPRTLLRNLMEPEVQDCQDSCSFSPTALRLLSMK